MVAAPLGLSSVRQNLQLVPSLVCSHTASFALANGQSVRQIFGTAHLGLLQKSWACRDSSEREKNQQGSGNGQYRCSETLVNQATGKEYIGKDERKKKVFSFLFESRSRVRGADINEWLEFRSNFLQCRVSSKLWNISNNPRSNTRQSVFEVSMRDERFAIFNVHSKWR